MNQIKKYQKEEKNNKDVEINTSSEIKKFIILIVVIVSILGIIYLISLLFQKKDYSSIFDNSLESNEIQFDEVIVGTMLKQKENSYYVLVLDKEDPYYDIFVNYVNNYRNQEYIDKIYTVELNSIFNSGAKAEYTDAANLKFNGTTFVKVENGNVSKTYSDSYEIGEIILKMTKELEKEDA